MKKMLSFLVLFLLAIFAANSFAADCRIIDRKEIPGSISGASADYEMVLSLAGLEPGELFFQGQEYAGGPWKSWPIVDNKNGTATAKISGWESGQPMEFSYGRGPYWTDPSCSSFEYEGHFRVVLGEKRNPNIVPMISSYLLMKKKNPIQIQEKIISIKEVSIDGPLGDYEIVVGLNSLPKGIPFFQGQSYADGPWKSWPIVDNGNGTATATISGWSRGSFIEFSFGVYADDEMIWVDPSGSPYLYAGHFRAELGDLDVCMINDFGDSLILRVTDLGDDVYRIYPRFPMEGGFKSLFLKGQEYFDGPWISWSVAGNYPCYYVDVTWPYSGSFHFSFGIIKEDNTELWVDPAGSKFICEDHLCLKLSVY